MEKKSHQKRCEIGWKGFLLLLFLFLRLLISRFISPKSVKRNASGGFSLNSFHTGFNNLQKVLEMKAWNYKKKILLPVPNASKKKEEKSRKNWKFKFLEDFSFRFAKIVFEPFLLFDLISLRWWCLCWSRV